MSFLSGNGASSFSGVAVTVPASSGANQRIAVLSFSIEYSVVPTSVVGNLSGTSLRAGTSSASTSGIEAIYGFYLNEADLIAIGTGAKSLTFTVTGGGGNQGRQSQWAFFDGRSQSAPVWTTNFGNATSTSASVNVTAAANGADIYGAACADSGGIIIPSAGFTATYNALDGGSDAAAVAMYQPNVIAGSYAPGYTNTLGPSWAFFGVSLEAAAVAGATITPPAGSDILAGVVPTVTAATSTVIAPITARHGGILVPNRRIFLPSLKRAA